MASEERNVWLTVPNILTFLRLIAIVPFAMLAIGGRDRGALILYLIAGLTDTLDGTIARYLGQTSKIGRLLDPVTDKLFTGVAFIVLSFFRDGFARMPAWLTIGVLLRDAFILTGSLLVYRLRGNTGFKPSVYGKLNTFLEIGIVVLVLAQGDVAFLPPLLPSLYVLVLISLLVSTADYLRTGLQMLRAPQ